MRGDDQICGSLLSYTDLEDRVRADHPLRAIREIANAALAARSSEFAALYRTSVPPEELLRAMLVHAFYAAGSERQLVERIEADARRSTNAPRASQVRREAASEVFGWIKAVGGLRQTKLAGGLGANFCGSE